MKKVYVLDTNVLLSDPESLLAFEDNDLIIPIAVLEELDAHKNRQDEVGNNARKVSRILDSLRQEGKLDKGITLKTGGVLKVVHIDSKSLQEMPPELKTSKVDNMLIAFMLNLSKTIDHAVLITKDVNVRIKCDSLGLNCSDYLKQRIVDSKDDLYRGVQVITTSSEILSSLYDELGDKKIPLKDLEKDKVDDFHPNQIVVLKSNETNDSKSTVITRVKGDDLVLIEQYDNVYGLKPKNKEQKFSLDLLMNPAIKLVTLVGKAGTGKTLLALAASLAQVKNMMGVSDQAPYERLIVSKPVQPMGRDIGFLPGDIDDKMQPWVAPIRDNLQFLMSGKQKKKSNKIEEPYLALLQERGIIEIEALSFIRGRSIPNSIIVIDEAQNLSIHELKTIITRAGEGTKIILTGDIDQIDNTHVDVFTNGLSYAIEKFKREPIAAHVTLLKGERSELATVASQIL